MRVYYFLGLLAAQFQIRGIVPGDVLQLFTFFSVFFGLRAGSGQPLRKHNVLQRHKGNDVR